ncbi:phosphoribose diphosphate--decaprenyl-phosphate phosphoribosyltransferase [Bacillus sp. HMSC76G11]|uniref:Decaprenyl-phosphate phosphoribosyltransferase n=2 Tax=Metabacillus idriensis TaxID=324768 RepID=A0A6I2MHM7_9BACI|nr:decaprenyl-phosphate phosphoribosyltransferase [Metabacillus idriensis]OHR68147.1 phosphoribose diphosphate--decaprenyl-phosphate phosphoribosyltransferase [Bacillus sp. HMSC76G11]
MKWLIMELSKIPKGAYLLFKQLRPKQWTKNLIVFAAPLFSMQLMHEGVFLKSLIGFFLFCFVSSCVYILNDFVDRKADRMHPEKKHRPMASGALNPLLALTFGFLLLISSIWAANIFNSLFAICLSIYFIINVLYSLKLKHIVLLDILLIASGFVLRAVGGALVINVPLTEWFLLCALWLSMFLAVSKRRHELFLLQKTQETHRKVLKNYSIALLDQYNSIFTTATIISYALFAFSSEHSEILMWSIPLVLYGICRYLYLIHQEGKGGKPEQVLLEDKPILITTIIYVLYIFITLT